MLTFSLTTLRYPLGSTPPGGVPVEPERRQRLTQFTDGEVVIPFAPSGESRSAKVTISVYDEACKDILPLERFLFVRYLDTPVFWGPLTDPEWDYNAGTVTINAVGPDLRLVKHFLVVGDVVDGNPIAVSGAIHCPATSDGMWDVILAAYNTGGQTARGVPDLGIARGATGTTFPFLGVWSSGTTYTAGHEVTGSDGKGYVSIATTTGDDPVSDAGVHWAPAQGIQVQRGDGVMDKLKDLGTSAIGPDFDFEPQELAAGAYALFNTYDRQGTDKSDAVKFHYGWGQDNLDGLVVTPSGSSVVTHRHTISADGQHQGTAAAVGPSARFGIYVEWDAVDFNPSGATDAERNAVLADSGKSTVLAYGEPPPFMTLTLKTTLDNGTDLPQYLTDFIVGDVVDVHGRKGNAEIHYAARVVSVTLTQSAAAGAVVLSLSVVPHILTDADVNTSET